MNDTLHNAIIEKACRDGWQRGSWKQAFVAKCRERPDWEGEITDDGVREELLDDFRRIPDAWRFVVEDENTSGQKWNYPVLILEFLEVEIAHPMPLEKRREYVAFWWRLDSTTNFHFRVYRAERYKAPELWLDTETIYHEMSLVG